MQGKLIAELREWRGKWATPADAKWVEYRNEFDEILSRHEAEKGEGLREQGWIKWTGEENLVPYRLYLLQTEDTEELNGMPSAVVVGYPKEFSNGWDWIHPGANVKGKVLFFKMLPEDINPPLWPGLHGKTLAHPTPTKPTEPLAVESIEDLATRKGFQVAYEATYTLLHNPKSDMPSTLDRQFHLEREARAYLEGLADKESAK